MILKALMFIPYSLNRYFHSICIIQLAASLLDSICLYFLRVMVRTFTRSKRTIKSVLWRMNSTFVKVLVAMFF